MKILKRIAAYLLSLFAPLLMLGAFILVLAVVGLTIGFIDDNFLVA
jgi:hypothetical protein